MSKGMQQRLGIAQALIGSPRLLLLDEPTSALDPAGRRTVRALLEDLRERGVSVLLNSHLLSEVELVCDRVAIIDHGSVVAAGTPAELSRPGGVEVETAAGTRTFAQATRDDVPRIVRELVAAGEDVFGVARPQLDARGRLPRGGRPRVSAHVATPPGELRAALIIARFVLRESLRRRVFVVIGLLTLVFLGLYGLATWQAFEAADELSAGNRFGVDANTLVGATLAGLSLFAILFLGTILAVFLTLGAVRGDAERGLLQPLLVRPLRRRTLLLGRWLGATAVCAPYVILVALGAFVLTDALGGWWPDRTIGPLLALALGVAILAALSLAGSIVLPATANGIAVFMLFGAGLTVGLLGQIAEGISSDRLAADLRHRELGAPVRGALPGRARRPDRGHRRLREARDRPRPVRRRRVRRRRPVDLLAGLPRRGRGGGDRRPRAPRPLGAAGSRSSAARPRRPAPRRPAARRPASRPARPTRTSR